MCFLLKLLLLILPPFTAHREHFSFVDYTQYHTHMRLNAHTGSIWQTAAQTFKPTSPDSCSHVCKRYCPLECGKNNKIPFSLWKRTCTRTRTQNLLWLLQPQMWLGHYVLRAQCTGASLILKIPCTTSISLTHFNSHREHSAGLCKDLIISPNRMWFVNIVQLLTVRVISYLKEMYFWDVSCRAMAFYRQFSGLTWEAGCPCTSASSIQWKFKWLL